MPAPPGRGGRAPAPPVYMMIDPATQEAYRLGEGPQESGPLLFTTRARLDDYARSAGIGEYQVVEVPGYVLGRMRGKPHWVDGERRG